MDSLARFWKNAYKCTEELYSGFQIDRYHDPTRQIGRQRKATVLPHLTSRLVVYKLWRCSAFSSVFSPHMQIRRLTHLATNSQSTITASATPHRSDNDDGPQPRLVIPTHDASIWRLAYLPDGRRVVTGSRDGTVKVWNLENGRQEGTTMGHESKICGLAVTQDGTNIISGDANHWKIKVWNTESHELVKEWTHTQSNPIVAISPDDRLIAVGGRAVDIYTMEGRQVNHSSGIGNRVCSMCFSPDGKKLAFSTLFDDIHVYDVARGRFIVGPLRGHQDWVNFVLWSHDGSRLFSASDDKTIRCWNSDTGEQIGHPWKGHTGPILSLSLSPVGSILASASWDETVRFWDATTGNPIGQHLQHVDSVTTVCFSPFGESVASGGWDGKIYLWRVPWLNSVENRARTFIRCSSVSILIVLS